MNRISLLLVLAALACGDSDASSSAGASERDICDAVAQCIFGVVDDDADAFADLCVSDHIFAEGSAVCRACLVDLSCADLEAAFDGDATAQAKCPSCD